MIIKHVLTEEIIQPLGYSVFLKTHLIQVTISWPKTSINQDFRDITS